MLVCTAMCKSHVAQGSLHSRLVGAEQSDPPGLPLSQGSAVLVVQEKDQTS